jgi:hypothetical protein
VKEGKEGRNINEKRKIGRNRQPQGGNIVQGVIS